MYLVVYCCRTYHMEQLAEYLRDSEVLMEILGVS